MVQLITLFFNILQALDQNNVFPNQEVDGELYKLSMQLLKQAKSRYDTECSADLNPPSDTETMCNLISEKVEVSCA